MAKKFDIDKYLNMDKGYTKRDLMRWEKSRPKGALRASYFYSKQFEKETAQALRNRIKKAEKNDPENADIYKVFRDKLNNRIRKHDYDIKDIKKDFEKEQRAISKFKEYKVNKPVIPSGSSKNNKDYDEDERLRYLGIGPNGITLSDGTTYTQDDFKKFLEAADSDVDAFFDDKDITQIKYTKQRYGNWFSSIGDKLDELYDSLAATDRDIEALEILMG